MEKKFIFNSSIPRSGATVFQNIIAQNPDFYVTPDSGFIELIYGARGNYQMAHEFKAQDARIMDAAFLAFCQKGMQGYFGSLTDKPLVIDKNAAWGASLLFAKQFVDNPKIICIVRDLRAVFASIEKQFRTNPLKSNHVQNPSTLAGTTLSKRIGIWATSVPLGLALDRLRDIIDQGYDSQMLFIRYEDLCSNPEIELGRFYEFTGVAEFKHDFNKLPELKGDVVRPILEMLPKDYEEILGFENCQQIKNNYGWFFKKFAYL